MNSLYHSFKVAQNSFQHLYFDGPLRKNGMNRQNCIPLFIPLSKGDLNHILGLTDDSLGQTINVTRREINVWLSKRVT